MAEEPYQNLPPTSLYPPPPYFWESFTPDNIAAVSSLSQQPSLSSPDTLPTSQTLRMLNLPPELRFLQPPEPPSDGIYRCFGAHYDLKDPLPSLHDYEGVEVLYSPPSSPKEGRTATSNTDRAFILKKLTKSLLLNFLEMVGTMSVNQNAAEYQEKLSDMQTLFTNMHHLLNEYRPHQARESLIMLLEEQVERARIEREGIEKVKGEVEAVLEGLERIVEARNINDASGTAMDVDPQEESADIWAELVSGFA